MVTYLTNREIRKKVQDFLKTYGIDDIPVPIERIIEADMGIDIIPIPGLSKNYDVEGFLSSDLKCISVDQRILEDVPTRYRFTLAHEVGHLVLHGEVYKRASIGSVQDWMDFLKCHDEEDRSNMEHEGYTFAGLLLVPPWHLHRHFLEALPKIQSLIDKARAQRIQRSVYLGNAVNRIGAILARTFDVSTDVISRRIKADGLVAEIP